MAGTITWTDMASDTNSGTSNAMWIGTNHLGKSLYNTGPMVSYSVTYVNLYTEIIGLSYTVKNE